MSDIIYRIDNNDMITYISVPPWDEFALENKGEDIIEENIINKSIWSFIADAETAHIYQMIIDKVRVTRKKISIPFRCDAPDKRRLFIIEVDKHGKNSVNFQSRLRKEEKRESIQAFETDAIRSEEFIRVCSWCKKVYVPHLNKWVEVEEAIIKLKLYSMEKLPRLTHTICDPCRQKLHQHLK